MFPYIRFTDTITLPLYGPVFMIGFFIALLIARKVGPDYGVAKEDILFGTVYGGIGLLIGAKLLYFITKLPSIIRHFDVYCELFKASPLNALAYAFGGLVFYGGLIGAFLGVLRYCCHFKVSFIGFLDVYAPLIPLVHGFGLIGCFLAGCCYGKEYHGFLSVQFPYNELVPELCEVPRIPVQLIEAGLNFIVFIILFVLLRKRKLLKGRLMGVYLLYYTVARFFLEMLRGDILRGGIGNFSTSQLISLLVLPFGIWLLFGKRKETTAK